MCNSKIAKENLDSSVLKQFGGFAKNNLKDMLQISAKEYETELSSFVHSNYIDTENLGSCLKPYRSQFTVLSLNTQSLNAKFSKIQCILNDLKKDGFEFSVICLQETWFKENTDTGPFELPNYKLIWQPYSTTVHGGLACYVHKNSHYSISDIINKSRIWEGQFIDISGGNLTRKVKIGNIYKPPKDNKSNENLTNFIDEITPYILKCAKNNAESIITGDFNINLLEINDREIYNEYLDLFINNGFLPKLTLPTRFTKKNGTLIDQMFCKITENTIKSTSRIIFSQISDHLPYYTCIDVKKIK